MDFWSSITQLRDESTRAITAENPRGEKGAGGKATSTLGPGRKGKPAIEVIRAGESVVLADIEGPGEIRHVWITLPFATPAGNFVLRDLVLRMYWDDEKTPSVEAPVGDFFCNGFGLRQDVMSQLINVNPDGGFNSYWPMPFRKRARVELESQHAGDIKHIFFQIDYALGRELGGSEAGYFHAQWRRESVTRRGVDYTILDGVTGKGHYVGTYLALAALERYWYGEGEVKFYLDGDADYPTICGTGTEDYFGGAWGFVRKENGLEVEQSYSAPYLGHLIVSNRYPPAGNSFSDIVIPMHSFYRWHVADPIRFDRDIRATIQQIGLGDKQICERQDDVSTVAYWYQREPHAPFPSFPSVDQRRPR